MTKKTPSPPSLSADLVTYLSVCMYATHPLWCDTMPTGSPCFSFGKLIDIITLIYPVFCRSELSSTQRELDKAKEMYISVCEAKDKLEDDVNRRLQEQIEKEVQEVS